jgi:DNA-binding response OmpR family regulator
MAGHAQLRTGAGIQTIETVRGAGYRLSAAA